MPHSLSAADRLMGSVVIKSVGIDFHSQISDLRKRETHLVNHLFFNAPQGTPEFRKTQAELGKTRNALSLISDLEVHPD